MACPFFDPAERFDQTSTRMPLGDFWRGVCRAQEVPFTPDDSALNELCNMGYARGRCPRYGDATSVDAVRFLVTRDQGDTIRIEYAVERNHHPQTTGALEFARSLETLSGAAVSSLIERQALAYLKSYLRRKPVPA